MTSNPRWPCGADCDRLRPSPEDPLMLFRENHPNVIVFFTDQQRHDSAGIHGNPLDLTPNFDRMAHRGTHVYHSFTPQPLCGPSRSVIQTGLYPTTTGFFR